MDRNCKSCTECRYRAGGIFWKKLQVRAATTECRYRVHGVYENGRMCVGPNGPVYFGKIKYYKSELPRPNAGRGCLAYMNGHVSVSDRTGPGRVYCVYIGYMKRPGGQNAGTGENLGFESSFILSLTPPA